MTQVNSTVRRWRAEERKQEEADAVEARSLQAAHDRLVCELQEKREARRQDLARGTHGSCRRAPMGRMVPR